MLPTDTQNGDSMHSLVLRTGWLDVRSLNRDYFGVGGSTQGTRGDRQDAYISRCGREHRQQQRLNTPHPGISFR